MKKELLYCDLETYSPVPIKHGAHAYSEQAEVLLFAYAFGSEEPEVWDATDGSAMPEELELALADPSQTTVWHNGAMFDRVVLRPALGINLPISRIHDTMVQALAHGLPGSLGHLGEILKTTDVKDKRGKQLINLFCKPRPKSSKIARATSATHPKEWQEFKEYAASDIKTMRAIIRRIPRDNYRGEERALWELDQLINDRGVRVDLDLARAAIKTVEEAQRELSNDTNEITEGEVTTTTQRDKLLKHILNQYGVALPDLQASTIERRINDENLPVQVRELLAIRQQASTTSTTKYKALLNMVSSDGILRGTTQFCGASRTRRWAGRGFQLQNLPSKGLPPAHEVEEGIKAICAGAAGLIYRDPMKMVSAAIRGCLIPREGKKMFVSDLSNIEGRDAAWLAGEDWKLKAFSDLDNGTGADLYRLAYAKSFGIPVEQVDGGKDKGPQRQIGKVQELALQYEGGVGAFITFSLVYNIDLEEMAADAWDNIPRQILEQTLGAWDWASKKKATFGLSKKAYMVCDALKRLWRQAHPAISSYWGEIALAARDATLNPGRDFQARRLRFRRDGAWLRMVLPSGGALFYASPNIDPAGKLSYLGINSYTRRWERINTYGGKLFENACQAVARDVMAYNMPTMELAGYQILATVHDEVITEAEDGRGATIKELSTILASVPPWGKGLPLSASGFESYRYKKD